MVTNIESQRDAETTWGAGSSSPNSSEERLTVEQSTMPPGPRKPLEVGIHQTFEVTQSSADAEYGERSHRIREHV